MIHRTSSFLLFGLIVIIINQAQAMESSLADCCFSTLKKQIIDTMDKNYTAGSKTILNVLNKALVPSNPQCADFSVILPEQQFANLKSLVVNDLVQKIFSIEDQKNRIVHIFFDGRSITTYERKTLNKDSYWYESEWHNLSFEEIIQKYCTVLNAKNGAKPYPYEKEAEHNLSGSPFTDSYEIPFFVLD